MFIGQILTTAGMLTAFSVQQIHSLQEGTNMQSVPHQRPVKQPKALSKRQKARLDELLVEATKAYEMALRPETDAEGFIYYLEKAEATAHKILGISKRVAEAHNLLSRIELERGDLTKASQFIEAALTIDESNPGYLYSAGHVNMAMGRINDAIRCFSQSIDLDNSATRAKQGLAYAYYVSRDFPSAFKLYRDLAKTNLSDPSVSQYLFETLNQISISVYDEEIEQDLLRYIKEENVDHFLLGHSIWSLLKSKYHYFTDPTLEAIKRFSCDELFLLSLQNLQICDPRFEKLVSAIRYFLLKESSENMAIPQEYIPCALSICQHSFNNEFVYFVSDEETAVINNIRRLIENQSARNEEIEGALILYAMYEPLVELDCAEELLKNSNRNQPIVKNCLYQHIAVPFKEIEQAKILDKNIDVDSLTKQVKDQYESNPYPRWHSLPYSTPTLYSRALERALIGYRAPKRFDEQPIKVLIAGVGTGKHAMYVARYFRNVEVTAIDISTRSLAYAKSMAIKLGIHNVTFHQADILNLELDQKFDIIECSGVLHHTPNPELGIKNLKAHLAKDGLIKLGLYSTRAREWIYKIKNIIKNRDTDSCRKSIRVYRQAIQSLPNIEGLNLIRDSIDFYSTSGCRDLLFHVHEVSYTPHSLKDFIESAELEFLGFVNVPDSAQKAYVKTYRSDSKRTDLNNWEELEIQSPSTFSRMYQFYLSRKDT